MLFSPVKLTELPVIYPMANPDPYTKLGQWPVPYLVKPVPCSCHCGHSQAWVLEMDEGETLMLGCCYCVDPPTSARDIVRILAMHVSLRLEQWCRDG